MAVVKRSISFRPEVWDEVSRIAGTQGGPVSTLVNTALDQYLRIARGRARVAEWQAKHGAFTQEEIAEADRILDAVGVPPLVPEA